MRVPSQTVAICLGFILTAYGALIATPVHAQTTDAAAAFTIQPEAGQPTEEVRRGYFWLAANPGQPRELRIVVKNTGAGPVDLRVDPVDGVQVKSGGVDYGTVGKPADRVGAWLTVQPERLTLAPGEARRITATLRAPEGAPPGEHVGGISVQDEKLQSGGAGTSVLIDVHYRQVLAVVAAVPGPLAPAMTIGEVTLVPAVPGSRAVVELRNSGNVLLKGTGTFEIGGGQGGSGALPFTVGTLLPDATALVQVDLPTVAVQPGIYDVRVRLVSDDRKPLAAWDGKVTVGAPAATDDGVIATTLLEPAQQLASATAGSPLLPIGLGIGIAIAGLALGVLRGRRRSPAASPATVPAISKDPTSPRRVLLGPSTPLASRPRRSVAVGDVTRRRPSAALRLTRGAGGCLVLLALTAAPLLAAPAPATPTATAALPLPPATTTAIPVSSATHVLVTPTVGRAPPAAAPDTATAAPTASTPGLASTTPTGGAAPTGTITPTQTPVAAPPATPVATSASPTASVRPVAMPTGSAPASAPPTASAAATGTAVASTTSSPAATPAPAETRAPTQTAAATPTAAPTRTTSPTASAAAPVVTGVSPATVTNDRPMILTVRGAGLVSGAGVVVGDRALDDVHLNGAGVLTGTLAPGLCPGGYTVAVTLPGGGRAVGGAITVSGVRSIAVDAPGTGPPVTLNGRTQATTMRLAAIHVTDTTCGDAWRLRIVVELRHENPGRPSRLLPLAVRIDAPAGGSSARADVSGATGLTTALLTVPHARDLVSATLLPVVELRIPASARSGRYVPHLDVAFAPSR